MRTVLIFIASRESRAMGLPASRLDQLRAGMTIVINHVDGALDATTIRLMEMGLVPGASVTITRTAPLGDPLEVAVCGTRLCLRQQDAHRFVVDVTGAT